MADLEKFPQEHIDTLFEKAQELWIFVWATKEDLVDILSSEEQIDISECLDLSAYPQSVVKRVWNRPKGLSKLLDIKIISMDPEKGNTIEVGGKRFSFLRPEVDGENVFQCPEEYGFQHVRYIYGPALDSEAEKANKKLFATYVEQLEFIKKHIPGTDMTNKFWNFVELMWLEKSGVRYINGKWNNMGTQWYAWTWHLEKDVKIQRTPESKAYTFDGIWCLEYWDKWGFSKRENEIWVSTPAICFEDIGFEQK